MKQKTKFSVGDKPRFITMHDVLCTEENLAASASGKPIAFSEVVLEFTNSSRKTLVKYSCHKRSIFYICTHTHTVARSIISDLKLAQQLLQVQYLTGPRWGEQVIVQRLVCNLSPDDQTADIILQRQEICPILISSGILY